MCALTGSFPPASRGASQAVLLHGHQPVPDIAVQHSSLLPVALVAFCLFVMAARHQVAASTFSCAVHCAVCGIIRLCFMLSFGFNMLGELVSEPTHLLSPVCVEALCSQNGAGFCCPTCTNHALPRCEFCKDACSSTTGSALRTVHRIASLNGLCLACHCSHRVPQGVVWISFGLYQSSALLFTAAFLSRVAVMTT